MASLEQLERDFKNHIHGGADTRKLEYDNLLDKPSTAGDSEKVKADAGDPTAQYLDGKVQYSVAVDGTNHKLQLSGDANTPGASKYYGTNAGGARGYYALPAGATDELVLSDAGDPSAGYLDAKVEYSIAVDTTNHKLKLSGDASSPGNSKYYGTNASGTRGFYDLPTGGGTDINDNKDLTNVFIVSYGNDTVGADQYIISLVNPAASGVNLYLHGMYISHFATGASEKAILRYSTEANVTPGTSTTPRNMRIGDSTASAATASFGATVASPVNMAFFNCSNMAASASAWIPFYSDLVVLPGYAVHLYADWGSSGFSETVALVWREA